MNEQLEVDGMVAGAPQMCSLPKSPYHGNADGADSASEPTSSPS